MKTETARLRIVAQHRIDAARGALVTAQQDIHTPPARLIYLRQQLRQAETALAELDPLAIPAPPLPARSIVRGPWLDAARAELDGLSADQLHSPNRRSP